MTEGVIKDYMMMIKCMDMESTHGLMEIHMKDHSLTIKEMDKGFTLAKDKNHANVLLRIINLLNG